MKSYFIATIKTFFFFVYSLIYFTSILLYALEKSNIDLILHSNPFKILIKATVRRSATSFENFKKNNSSHSVYFKPPRLFTVANDCDRHEENFQGNMSQSNKYRSQRNFSNETFRVSPIKNLSNKIFINNDDGL